MLEEFKQQYIDKCIYGAGFDEELNCLFEQVLVNEFEDDHEKMDQYIQSIADEYSSAESSGLEALEKENQELKQQMKMTQGAVMDLATMMLSQQLRG